MIDKTTLCVLPFIAVDHHADSGYGCRPCCLYDNSHWSVRHQDIKNYWPSPALQNLQKNMSLGIRDPGCQKCWQIEDLGQISMRVASSKERLADINISNPVLSQVKLMTGKTCNLACMMCFPTISSTIDQLWDDSYQWDLPSTKKKSLEYDWEMDSYIRTHCYELKYIEALGGEPLFNKDFLQLLNHLVDQNVASGMTLYLITNGSILTQSLIALLKKFKKVVFAVSVDGVALVNEYQRWPSKWSLLQSNLQAIQEHFDLSLLPTVTALNLARLHELYDYCDKHAITINNLSVVSHWPQLLPSNLPKKLRSMVDTRFRSLLSDDRCDDLTSLEEFVQKWDHKRGIRIVDYMPEWKGVFD